MPAPRRPRSRPLLFWLRFAECAWWCRGRPRVALGVLDCHFKHGDGERAQTRWPAGCMPTASTVCLHPPSPPFHFAPGPRGSLQPARSEPIPIHDSPHSLPARIEFEFVHVPLAVTPARARARAPAFALAPRRARARGPHEPPSTQGAALACFHSTLDTRARAGCAPVRLNLTPP